MDLEITKVYFDKNKKKKKPAGTMDDMAEGPEDIVSAEEAKAESTKKILKMLRESGAPRRKKKDQPAG